jgi:hypothetical protein
MFQDELTALGVVAAYLYRMAKNGFANWFRNHVSV